MQRAAKGPHLIEGWRIQARNIHALMVRDMMMRYGRENIGFAWVILEPMILTCGVMVIWSAMGAHKEGVKIVELVLTGYMPLTLWRHLTNNSVNIFRLNANMLFHRRISLFDLLFARYALETIATSAGLLIIYLTLLTLDLVHEVARLDLILLGWLMMAWIGSAFGACTAVITEKWEVAERFVQPLQYLNIPISGAFFFVDWLPTWGQKIIFYHPLVHCWEVFRAGYFGDVMLYHYSLPYFTAVTFVLTFLGLRGVRRAREYVRLN